MLVQLQRVMKAMMCFELRRKLPDVHTFGESIKAIKIKASINLRNVTLSKLFNCN